MQRKYESCALQPLVEKARRPRPIAAVWHPSDIDWLPQRENVSYLIKNIYPKWFLDLSTALLPPKCLGQSHEGTFAGLMSIKAVAYGTLRAIAIRDEVERLFVKLDRVRSTEASMGLSKEPYRYWRGKPQTRKTAPRRQRRKVENFQLPPYLGERINLPPLHPDLLRRPGRPWTETQSRYLHMRRQDGRKCVEIGQEMGTSKNAILSRLYRIGLLANGTPVPYEHPSKRKAVIGTRTSGVPQVTNDKPAAKTASVPTLLLGPGHPLVVKPKTQKGWTDLQVIYLISRWKAKSSATKIAFEMETTKGTIIGKLDRLGLLIKGKVKDRMAKTEVMHTA